MNFDKYVTNLELSKRLKEIGVKQNSLFVWISIVKTGFNFIKLREEWEPNSNEVGAFNYSALIASELGELLPNTITVKGREPLDNYRIVINKFYSVNDDRSLTNNYIINYECDSTEATGENAWFRRKLTNNIYDSNLANAMAKMLIYLIENGLIKND